MTPDRHDIKVAVLTGGVGEERQISLLSGQTIAEGLNQAGFSVITADITPDDLSILDDKSIMVFFPALHGKFGEDGQLQRILEQRACAYTGCGPEASRIGFDKVLSKQAFIKAGVDVPHDLVISSKDDLEGLAAGIAKLGEKVVVKPVRQGSSVGVEIVSGPENAARKAAQCLEKYGQTMVEQFIAGREVTVGIVMDRVLPIVEIKSAGTFYDYNAKYEAEDTQYLFDTIIDKALVERINRTGQLCCNAIGARHISRVDMILDDSSRVYVLEINTLPGFTSHSLVPKAAAKTGMGIADVCAMMVEDALNNAN